MDLRTLFEQIMNFEHDNINKFMEAKVNGIHLYPVFRYNILFEIFKNIAKVQTPHATSRQTRFWLLTLVNSFIRSSLKNTKISRDINTVDAVAISNYALRRKKVNGKEFDVIYDYFLPEITDNYLLIEQPFRFRVSKNPWTRYVFYSLPLSVIIRANKLLIKRSSPKYEKILKDFSDLISKSIYDFFEKNNLVLSQGLMKIFKNFVYVYEYSFKIADFIKSLSPRLLFVHCGSYGGLWAIIIKLCKDYDIKIAEAQHGMVNKFHLAYNYGFEDSEYKEYLPDFFLTWGKYWSNQLERLPVNKIIIGNPEFTTNLLEFLEKDPHNSYSYNTDVKSILIVSQGIITNRLVEIAKDLSTKLPDNYQIIYKLHPGEVPFEDRYRSLYDYKNITVVKFGNIYEYIKKAHIIIGHTSTTILEALPFKKHIFILDDQLSKLYIPTDVGIRFKDVDELKEMILNLERLERNDIGWKYYWETNWKNNLRNFIQSLGR